jgi:uncharacterized protein YegP (UPF0339 family)
VQIEVYRDNGGRFHWRLIRDDGIAVAVSSAKFTTEPAARDSADAIRADIGLMEPSR